MEGVASIYENTSGDSYSTTQSSSGSTQDEDSGGYISSSYTVTTSSTNNQEDGYHVDEDGNGYFQSKDGTKWNKVNHAVTHNHVSRLDNKMENCKYCKGTRKCDWCKGSKKCKYCEDTIKDSNGKEWGLCKRVYGSDLPTDRWIKDHLCAVCHGNMQCTNCEYAPEGPGTCPHCTYWMNNHHDNFQERKQNHLNRQK